MTLLDVARWALAYLVSTSDLSDDHSEAMELQRALRAAIAREIEKERQVSA